MKRTYILKGFHDLTYSPEQEMFVGETFDVGVIDPVTFEKTSIWLVVTKIDGHEVTVDFAQ